MNGDGAIAIDSQFMPTAELCVAGLKQRAPKGIEPLINTHHHGDHTSGNGAFRPAVKRILAHENCVTWQRKVAEEAAAKPPAPGAAAPGPPVVADSTFKDTWAIDFGNEKVEVRYYGPGHTSGDAVIFFERANVIHAGDLLFRRVHPRVDGPAGAAVVNWHAILQKLAASHGNDTAFIFGHGKDGIVLAKKADVQYFGDYLAAALEHVRAGIKAGQPKEAIAKASALKGFDDVVQVNPGIYVGRGARSGVRRSGEEVAAVTRRSGSRVRFALVRRRDEAGFARSAGLNGGISYDGQTRHDATPPGRDAADPRAPPRHQAAVRVRVAAGRHPSM